MFPAWKIKRYVSEIPSESKTKSLILRYISRQEYSNKRVPLRLTLKEVKLGDYTEFTEEEVNAIWTMLRREIRKKIDIDTLHEYAEPKKIESDTPPEIKDGENPIWVDTSK